MATVTTTVTLNAAFFQEIKDDHHELVDLLNLLEQHSFDGRWHRVSRRQLCGMFCELRDRVAMHFALEEAYGYFEDAVSVAPRLSIAANRLRGDHESLYQSVCDLAEISERLVYDQPVIGMGRLLAEQFGFFLEVFRQHEADECRLIQQAFTDDIGAAD